MSKFIEHNSSGWNGSGRTSINLNVHQSQSSGNAVKFDLMASKSKPVK